jgi:hypothetical protein
MQSTNYVSMRVHAFFVALTGLQLIFTPNMLLRMFGFEPTTEIWIMVMGVIIVSLSPMYYQLSKSSDSTLVRTTVFMRFFVATSLVLFALLGKAALTIVLFAGIDFATAIYTWFELKK